MGDVIKQATFRLAEDAVEKFKALAIESGYNQAEMFDSLVNNFELAQAKNQISNRGKEIETFQGTVNTLIGMFVNSLAINQSSEERIREDLSLELRTKDNSISDLQEEKIKNKEELKTIKEDLVAKDKATKENETIINTLNKDVTQKNSIVDSLQSQLNTLNAIVDEYKGFKDTNTILESTMKDLNAANANLVSKNTDIQFKFENETKMKDFFEKQIVTFKESLDISNQDKKALELEHKKEIESLKIEMQNKLEKENLKTKTEFDEKLSFEKEKMQLDKDKINNELEINKLKYNDLIEKNKQQRLVNKNNTKTTKVKESKNKETDELSKS